MRDFFKPFKSTTKAEWEAKLIADLKGKESSLLSTFDSIEDIEFQSYAHSEDLNINSQTTDSSKFKRGINTENNTWKNNARISVFNDKEANKKALDALNLGADSLSFEQVNEHTNWEVVLKEIKLEYIETQFCVFSSDSFQQLNNINLNKGYQFDIQFDFLNSNAPNFEEIASYYQNIHGRFCLVNGFGVQQAGATTWQELAFCLSTGHEYLVKLMQAGFSLEKASSHIQFNIGVGSNYFYEIAKIRALKRLWFKIIDAYSPQAESSYTCHIHAFIGHLNKSILDPHTNLLRQTTEAMSAAISGVHAITILPHDLYSSDGTSVLSERMAINISTILQEESYLAKVIDPLGGSYSIELLTDQIAAKAWRLFQEFDANGGAFDVENRAVLFNAIHEKRAKRITSFLEGKTVGIGMNKFKNPDQEVLTWQEVPSYLELKTLILENELIAQSV